MSIDSLGGYLAALQIPVFWYMHFMQRVQLPRMASHLEAACQYALYPHQWSRSRVKALVVALLTDNMTLRCQGCMFPLKQKAPIKNRLAIRCSCGRHVSLCKNTAFAESRLPIEIWLRAFGLFVTDPKGLSARRLQKLLDIGCNRIALQMLRKTRELAGRVIGSRVETDISTNPETETGAVALHTIWPSFSGPFDTIVIAVLQDQVQLWVDRKEPVDSEMPEPCRVRAEPLKVWLKRRHKNSPMPEHLRSDLDEYMFRLYFNRAKQNERSGIVCLIKEALNRTPPTTSSAGPTPLV